ncbi:DUF1269 domain-containing protein [Microlunatus ginsengisoli]|uniref:DUF1269 domain-containing protein n=1 Tax=Microlunatus ginsengisoli TaxID=363863 RepID=A0ABP7AD60_9ACTN
MRQPSPAPSGVTAFSAWVFDTPDTAGRLLPAFEGSPHRPAVRVDDVAVVSWPADRLRPLAWHGCPVDDALVLAGAFWGMLFAEVFLLPLSCPPAGGPGPSDGQLAHLGLDAAVVRSLRDLIVADTSAVLVVHRANAAEIGAALPIRPDPSLTVLLTPEQVGRLRAGFADDER